MSLRIVEASVASLRTPKREAMRTHDRYVDLLQSNAAPPPLDGEVDTIRIADCVGWGEDTCATGWPPPSPRLRRTSEDTRPAEALAQAGVLAALRASTSPQGEGENKTRVPLGHPAADACLKGGLVTGALHEVFASEPGAEGAASGFAAALAARVAKTKKLLWIRQDFSALEFGEVSATGLLELGIDPGRVLVLRAPDVTNALRATGDALSCAALGAVILEIPGAQKKLDLVTSRRLTLAAAAKGVSVFLLRFMAEPDSSSAETRWKIAPAISHEKQDDWGFARFAAQLTRNRHGQTGDWVMEWNSDEQSFGAPDSGAVVSVSGDGPAHREATG